MRNGAGVRVTSKLVAVAATGSIILLKAQDRTAY